MSLQGSGDKGEVCISRLKMGTFPEKNPEPVFSEAMNTGSQEVAISYEVYQVCLFFRN